MTPRQLEALRTIRRLTEEHGFAPTFRELGEAMGITATAAYGLCQGLRDQGQVYFGGEARSLRLPGLKCPTCHGAGVV